LSLRGWAWITDIVAPIPQIRLKAEHISIDYALGKFHKGNEELWLPQSAELFFELGGRRIERRLRFSNYLLFSVDENQKIAAPTVNAESANQRPSPSRTSRTWHQLTLTSSRAVSSFILRCRSLSPIEFPNC
jgi:hypothetical protein